MALQAVGWLSQKLGVDVTGRNKTEEAKSDVFAGLSETVFGSSEQGNKRVTADGTEVDENGLPVGRDWYYYDAELKRFNVRPDAPQHIRDEHARQVAALEAASQGTTETPAPPPPPPPPAAPTTSSPMSRNTSAPQYADTGFFSGN